MTRLPSVIGPPLTRPNPYRQDGPARGRGQDTDLRLLLPVASHFPPTLSAGSVALARALDSQRLRCRATGRPWGRSPSKSRKIVTSAFGSSGQPGGS